MPIKSKNWPQNEAFLAGYALTIIRIRIGAKVITHSRYVVSQMAEVAISQWLFDAILQRIRRLGPLMPAPT